MHTRSQRWRGVGALETARSFQSSATLSFGNILLTVRISSDGLVNLQLRHRTGGDSVKDAAGAADEDAVEQATGVHASGPSYAVVESVPWLEPTVESGPGTAEVSAGCASVVAAADSVTVTVPNGAFELRLDWSGSGFRLRAQLGAEDHVYGLGEKTGPFDRRGRSFVMWNTDESDHAPSADPLYQSIPFAILFSEHRSRGLFVDSPSTVYVDSGETEPDVLSFEVYDRELSVYFMAGPAIEPVIERFTQLTGRTPLPPRWALGYHQSRYSYYPDQSVLQVAQEFRDRSIPCDVIHLDIHYMDGCRVFTWDRERFPHPEQLIRQLTGLGFHTVVIVDPGVKADHAYETYRAGLAHQAFMKTSAGDVYVGEVWPGKAVFPDFTNDKTREWWAQQHRRLFDAGVAGIWNDMNEPADFTGDIRNRRDFTVPDDLQAANEGRPTAFGLVHNAYANGMNQATRHAFAILKPEERGFVLTRAGYAGIQRLAAVWTGDNNSWWEHLQVMIPMIMGLGTSGVVFAGADVGGFQENATPELFARWVEAAALTPFFRGHSNINSRSHEPWSFGPTVEAIARRYITLRYRLLPYIYTLFEEAAQTGHPVMRPLVYHFPQDTRVHRLQDEFLLGGSLLVAPVTAVARDHRSVYLPEGRWYDFWTGEPVAEDEPEPLRTSTLDNPTSAGQDRSENGQGGRPVLAEAPLGSLPLYVRGGSILPFESARQHTGASGDGVLYLLVAPDAAGRAAGSLYEDEGEGFGYRQGVYWKGQFIYDNGDVRLRIDHAVHTPRWRTIQVIVLGKARKMVSESAVNDYGCLDFPPDGGFELSEGGTTVEPR